MDSQQVESAMARETTEIPAAAERLLNRNELFEHVVRRIQAVKPRVIIFCGRGSSGHVGIYLRYLAETRLRLLATSAAPSIVTAYGMPPDMSGALFVVVSQSGRSPDLIATTLAAREAGAMTLAIVNDDGSPIVAASDLVLPIDAGLEHSVAATKTVVLSMIAGLRLVATLSGDDALYTGLASLPARLQDALACDWSAWAECTAGATAAFVVGRGYGLGCALEISLKVAEVLRVPSLGYSAAELRHGPRACVKSSTPVLFLRQGDQSAVAIDDLFADLKSAGVMVFAVGGTLGTLPWIGDSHPIYDPVVMLLPAYRAIEVAARRSGLDPDNPPYLSKITRTT